MFTTMPLAGHVGQTSHSHDSQYTSSDRHGFPGLSLAAAQLLCCHSHFIEKLTEEQRGEVSCPGSHSQEVVEAALERCGCSRAWPFSISRHWPSTHHQHRDRGDPSVPFQDSAWKILTPCFPLRAAPNGPQSLTLSGLQDSCG